jgi:NAD(P)H-flavin reductase/ferredoxin
MAIVRSKKLSTVAQINGRTLEVSPRQTVLQAALGAGINFPYSCGVGGCGTCKCRLTDGHVKQLTETGYLLSEDELDRGYILACQSVPESDIQIEVELSDRREVAGQVVAQRLLTHDIVQLQIQLEEPLAYKAGQFAKLRVDSLRAAARSYSFATPSSADGVVEFFVRRVPGGKLSPHLIDRDLRGQRVTVDGPLGDMWLRDSEGPLVLIAGGSGLAPILAILREAATAGVRRPTTVLFGARQERDLYALAELAELAACWGAPFRFVPVLSNEPAGSAWTGARGLVTEHLDEIGADAHAYVCGPPAMVDAAEAALRQRGVATEHMHSDRFSDQRDQVVLLDAPPHAAQAAQQASAWRSALHYAKFFSFHAIGLTVAAALLAGGHAITATLLAVLAFYMLGDALSGDDTSTPTFRYPQILTVQLWLALPLMMFITFAAVWSVSSSDPLGFGGWASQLSGYDLLAARAATTTWQHVAAWVLTGLMIGMIGTITGHELTHRTWDPLSLWIGRWLLSFSFDTSFAIEHVYGHHRYVSTLEDPATAPRGRNVYAHVLISTVRGNVSAWNIEARRLRKKHLPVLSWSNAALRGYLMSASLVAIAVAMGGWVAGAFFVACGLWGKALLEIVNYMEHYGLVRNPATPVQPRHSWNTNRRISSWTMFNLTRHSHHHAQGEVPYQDLRPYPNAPVMINGYLTTLLIALVPPLWHALMTPKVLAWDRDFATDEERKLAAEANARSGLPRLQQLAAASQVRVLPTYRPAQ